MCRCGTSAAACGTDLSFLISEAQSCCNRYSRIGNWLKWPYVCEIVARRQCVFFQISFFYFLVLLFRLYSPHISSPHHQGCGKRFIFGLPAISSNLWLEWICSLCTSWVMFASRRDRNTAVAKHRWSLAVQRLKDYLSKIWNVTNSPSPSLSSSFILCLPLSYFVCLLLLCRCFLLLLQLVLC